MSLNSYEFKETVIYIAESKSCYLTTANGTGVPLALPVCYELVSFSFFPQCLLPSKCPLIIPPVLHRLWCRSRQLLWDNYPVSGHEPSRLKGSNILTYKGLIEARNYLDKSKKNPKQNKRGGCMKTGVLNTRAVTTNHALMKVYCFTVYWNPKWRNIKVTLLQDNVMLSGISQQLWKLHYRVIQSFS